MIFGIIICGGLADMYNAHHCKHILQGFEKLIRDWPSDLYHIQTLVNAVVDSLDKHPKNVTLMQCLAEL